MIAVFTLLYAFLIWVVYVRFKIKPRPANLALAITTGLMVIGAILIFWRFSAPMSDQVVLARYVVPLVPQVSGPIEKIHAEANVPLRKGQDILFEIQKDPYEFRLSQAEASLRAAEQNVKQLEAGLKVAEAAIGEATAGLAAAQAELDVALETEKVNPAAVSRLRVVQLTQQAAAAEAARDKADAAKDQAAFALLAARDTVESLRAQVQTAQFNLEQCTVYAPADGFVVNWQAREGMMTASLPLAPVGAFVDTSDTRVVAVFPQNLLRNVALNDPVEMAFKSRPGEILRGKVDAIIQASGEGQFVATGQLSSASQVGSQGQFAVRIALDDAEEAKSLGLGTAGVASVYSKFGSPFHIISKVTMRIKAWMYYLIPM